MKIVFDLDGVLRDLNGYLNTKFDVPYPNEWFWKYQGKDIFQWVEEDSLMPLIYSPPTEYYWLIKHCFEKPEFWTNQPDKWRAKTKLWLDLHFDNYDIKYLDTPGKREMLDSNPGIWLLEDNPLFTHWDRILLIDRPYNKHIQEAIRIKGLEDLDSCIWRMIKTNEVEIAN